MTKEELKKLVKQSGTEVLTDAERAKAAGSFIDLPCGNTHYELKGEGKAVVLTHGYATPYFIYDKVFNALVEAGYKVLRYDLLGRGLSERVDAVYDAPLFARQLKELTEAVLGDEKFYLFGTSMGGTITTEFCADYPGRAEKLVLLAPAGMDTFKPPFYMTLCRIPGLGTLIFNMIGSSTLLKKCASELKYSLDEKDYFMRSFAACSKYKGFVKCTLSSLRNTILKTKRATEKYKETAKQNIPVLVIWGTDDRTMPYYQAERMKEVLPDVQLHTFEDSGHIFLFDEGGRTMNIVLPFLAE